MTGCDVTYMHDVIHPLRGGRVSYRDRTELSGLESFLSVDPEEEEHNRKCGGIEVGEKK
jgi:hypothetical protein